MARATLQKSIQDIRPAAHAGTLYPADPAFLSRVVDSYIADGIKELDPPRSQEIPKAIIAPHGGYVYSGKIAGCAYGALRNYNVQRVVLIGPSHTLDFPGIAIPDSSVFVTPLGELRVDREIMLQLERQQDVRCFEAAHYPEHSLEVQLPFIQRLFGSPMIVPLITGRMDAPRLSDLLESIWRGPETVFVISSDLSAQHTGETARRIDRNTVRAIQEFRHSAITIDQACGHRAIRAFLQLAARREMRCHLVSLRTSSEPGASKCTGYAAFHFYGGQFVG